MEARISSKLSQKPVSNRDKLKIPVEESEELIWPCACPLKTLLVKIEKRICREWKSKRMVGFAADFPFHQTLRGALQLRGLLIDVILSSKLHNKVEDGLNEVLWLLQNKQACDPSSNLGALCAAVERERAETSIGSTFFKNLQRRGYDGHEIDARSYVQAMEQIAAIAHTKHGDLAYNHPAMQLLGKLAGSNESQISPRILGIIGSGGTGKTTLLFRIMMHARLQPLEQVIFAELPNEEPTDNELMQVQASMLLQFRQVVMGKGARIENLKEGIENLKEGREALWAMVALSVQRSYVSATACLLIAIDNVWRVQDLERLLPVEKIAKHNKYATPCIISFTSRVQSTGKALQQMLATHREVPVFTWEQKPLAAAAAKHLLVSHARQAGGEKVKLFAEHEPFMGVARSYTSDQLQTPQEEEEDERFYRRMYRICDGIPLAIRRLIEAIEAGPAPGPSTESDVETSRADAKRQGLLKRERMPFLRGLLETVVLRNLRRLRESAQRALVDIVLFLHEWKLYTVGGIVGDAELDELKNYYLVESCSGQADVSCPEKRCLVRAIMFELLYATCTKPSSIGEEDALRGFRQASQEHSFQFWDPSPERFNQPPRWHRVKYMRLDLTNWSSKPIGDLPIQFMIELRILDVTGPFDFGVFEFQNQLRYIRFARNDLLDKKLSDAKLPVDLRHFELRECMSIPKLPESIYGCKRLQSLILLDCPCLQANDLHKQSGVWCGSLVELEVERCSLLEEMLSSKDESVQSLRSRLVLDLPPSMSLAAFTPELATTEVDQSPNHFTTAEMPLNYNIDEAELKKISAEEGTQPSKSSGKMLEMSEQVGYQSQSVRLTMESKGSSSTAAPDMKSQFTGHPALIGTDENTVLQIPHQCGKSREVILPLQFGSFEKLTVRDCECDDLEALQLQKWLYSQRKVTLTLQYCRSLLRLPHGIINVHLLRVLKLHGCSSLQELPMEMGRLTALETLDVHACPRLKELPKSLSDLTSLLELSLCACRGLEALPENIGKLSGLEILRIASCEKLSRLPDSMSKLVSLVQLEVQDCDKLMELPRRMGSYSYSFHAFDCLGHNHHEQHLKLKVMNLDDCSHLGRLPKKLRNFKELRTISLANCQGLKELSDSVCGLNLLVHLDLRGCWALQKLPRKFGVHLKALELLYLMECQSLRRLPSGFCRLEVLTELDMTGCANLEWLPQHFGSLKALRKLKLAYCKSLHKLPDSICKLDALVVMDMHGCYKLQELPAELGKLGKLETLDLRNCESLKSFPHVDEACDLQSLRELDLRMSHLELLVAEKGDLYFGRRERVENFFTLWQNYCSKQEQLIREM